MRFNKKDIERTQTLIQQSNNIVILTHSNPDGDAVGSSSAMFHYLQSQNKQVSIIFPNNIPHHLQFLVDNVRYTVAEHDFKSAKSYITDADLLIVMDMNKLERASDSLVKVFEQITLPTILIDHHLEPQDFDVRFSAPEMSSTCELTWRVLYKLTGKRIFPQNISTSLYAGIMTDTGSLSFSCNDPELYSVIAYLLKSGIKANKINQQIFDTYSIDRMKLLGYAISKKMVVFPKERAAFIYLSEKELNDFHYQPGDLEGVVNYCLKLETVDFCALLSERDRKIRMSFRSNNPDIDVNKFARKYWKGGGHVMAAGGKSFDKLHHVVNVLTQQIKDKAFMNCDG